ncbi:BnaC09g39280D [Brassica napus]|uniref:BnaC09g39280D protein n=2 Tax=Brassica TaxID=3705 RepID=A0A078FNH1_BRANA|nr:BnaC09g39280D [Brassica napus]
MGGGGGMEELTEDEERALRAQRKQIRSTCFSSFLLSLSAAQVLFFTLYGFFLLFNLKFRLCYVSCLYRLAHPGGPLKTNKAAALAKFLERKLQDPNGLSSIDPPLLRVSTTLRQDSLMITSFLKALVGLRFQEEESNTLPPLKTSRYLILFTSFENIFYGPVSSDDDKIENTKLSKKKKKKKIKEEKKKKKNKKHKQITVDEDAKLTRPNKKLKL